MITFPSSPSGGGRPVHAPPPLLPQHTLGTFHHRSETRGNTSAHSRPGLGLLFSPVCSLLESQMERDSAGPAAALRIFPHAEDQFSAQLLNFISVHHQSAQTFYTIRSTSNSGRLRTCVCVYTSIYLSLSLYIYTHLPPLPPSRFFPSFQLWPFAYLTSAEKYFAARTSRLHTHFW